MMQLRLAFGVAMVLMTASAQAEVAVTSSTVKAGYFLADDCTPTADPKAYNECVCDANIKKAQVSGLDAPVMTQINAQLAMLPEKLAAESCDGKPTTVPMGGLKVNTASADYLIAYQTPTTLTALVTYSTYGAGSEHPLEGTEGFTFDLKTGVLVDPIALMKPEQRQKADGYIRQELLKKYPAMYDEAKTRTDPYLTENGCDSCTIFYGKEGWVVRFQITAIAPYMIGEPEVIVPADLIPEPEKLMVKN